MKRIKNMKRFLICLISFLFIGCSIAGGAVILSNMSVSDNFGGGKSPPDENDVTQNAPLNDDLWTDAGNYATSFTGGSGTEEDPYQIATAGQLAYLAVLINDSSTNATYRALYYEQTADIDLSAHYWDPIGFSSGRLDTSYGFAGHYDGGGHSITGLFGENGLFGYVYIRNGDSSTIVEIHDVHIVEATITGTGGKGGILGQDYNLTTNIYNCSFSGSINGTTGNIGGIVGYGADSITNCQNFGGIVSGATSCIGGILGRVTAGCVINNCFNISDVSGRQFVGGIVGAADGGNCIITDCWNIGDVYASGADTRYGSAGGIIGALGGAYGGVGTIERCFNEGNITGRYHLGGIVGTLEEDCALSDCYNIGNVGSSTYVTVEEVGGIVGNGESGSLYVVNAYNTGNIVGSSNVGGIVGYCWTETVANCYNTGSVSGSSNTGAIVGYNINSASLISYCRWGVNCTLSSATGYGSSSNCSTMTETQAKTQSWYTTSSNWNSSYPWDFTNTWGFVSGKNDGYPVLESAQYTLIEYHSNYGTEEIISEYYIGDEPIEIYGDIFTRDGYLFTGWNTNANGTGTSYEAGQSYTGLLNLTLYAQWQLPIFEIMLDWTGIVGGSPNTIYLWYSDSYYSDEGCTNVLSRLSYPTNNGFTFRGFFSGMNGSGTQFVDSSGNFLTYTTMTTTWHAYFVANNPAYYDSEGGYWYIENGYMPQSRVTNTTTWNYLNSNWSSLSNGNTYSMGPTGNLQSKVYNGSEYCKYNNEYYLVEPIKWRLDYSSSQRSGYGTTTDTLAIMDTIVYVGRYSTGEINAGSGYSSVTVDYLDNNRISNTYLVSWTQSMPTFGTTSLNGTPTSVTARIFVSSIDEIERVAGSDAVKFSDLVSDFLKRTGNDLLYYTRNLGTNYNNIICLNENGDRTQRKPNLTVNQLGVQFTIKVTEYACV